MEKNNNLLIIGAGGHANSCLEVILNQKLYNVIGFTDNKKRKLKNFKVLGGDRDIHKFKKNCDNIHIGIGSFKDIKMRWLIFQRAKKLNFNFPKILSPNSLISNSATIGEGSIVMNHCIINTNVIIGKNVIINNKSLIEHDVTIGNNSNISTGVIVNGGVTIGENVFIGSGSVIRENICIPSNTIVGMGSIVLKNIKKKIYFNKL